MGGRSGIPMARRVELGNASSTACPARHCWVAGAVDLSGVTRPGLLVEWRSTTTGWEGRVVYVAELRPGGWVLVEQWVAATLLTST